MQNFNYHCHTSFEEIFDGRNTADEMLTAYEAKGFKSVGISNHYILNPLFNKLPFMHSQNLSNYDKALDFYKRSYEYIDNAASKHHIKVYKGFEVDYFEDKEWRNNFEKIIKELKPDYLIGSTHFLRNNDDSYLISLFSLRLLSSSTTEAEKQQMLRCYWRNIIREIKSGYFDFIAHFDYCTLFNLCCGEEWSEIKLEIIENMASQGIACEINTTGLREKNGSIPAMGRPFPDWWLIKELIKSNVPLLISDDAHRIEDTGFGFSYIEEKLSELGCKNRFYLKD